MNKALLKKLGIVLVAVMVVLAVAVFAIEQFHIGGVDLPLAEVVDAKNRDDILENQGGRRLGDKSAHPGAVGSTTPARGRRSSPTPGSWRWSSPTR